MSRNAMAIVSSLLFAVLAASLVLIPVPYVARRPGQTIDVLATADNTPVIEVTDAPTFPTEGDLTFTTVAVYGGPGRELTLWEYLMARARPGSDIRPRAEYYPPEATREQVDERNHAQMAFSQQEAAVCQKLAPHLRAGLRLRDAGGAAHLIALTSFPRFALGSI